MSNNKEAGYKILNVLAIESYFKREAIIDFNKPIDNNIELKTQAQKSSDGTQLIVELEVFLVGVQEGRDQYNSRVKMVGIFEKGDDSSLPDEVFVNVNAPAIIFPFVREHFAALALKAAVGTVLLPPLNFTKTDEPTFEKKD